MPECQAYGCVNKAGEGVSEGKRFFPIPNSMKFHANRSADWPSNGFTISELDMMRIILISLESRLRRSLHRTILQKACGTFIAGLA